MSRADNPTGSRFDWRYELDNIWAGMSNDLSGVTGQIVQWWLYDETRTEVDPIFGTGSATIGRRWLPPCLLHVVSGVKVEGMQVTNDRGRYLIDTLELTLSAQELRQVGLWDVVWNPDNHNTDRLVFENKVFDITQVRVRGLVGRDYATVAIAAQQVKREELVNDRQFYQYIALDKG